MDRKTTLKKQKLNNEIIDIMRVVAVACALYIMIMVLDYLKII